MVGRLGGWGVGSTEIAGGIGGRVAERWTDRRRPGRHLDPVDRRRRQPRADVIGWRNWRGWFEGRRRPGRLGLQDRLRLGLGVRRRGNRLGSAARTGSGSRGSEPARVQAPGSSVPALRLGLPWPRGGSALRRRALTEAPRPAGRASSRAGRAVRARVAASITACGLRGDRRRRRPELGGVASYRASPCVPMRPIAAGPGSGRAGGSCARRARRPGRPPLDRPRPRPARPGLPLARLRQLGALQLRRQLRWLATTADRPARRSPSRRPGARPPPVGELRPRPGPCAVGRFRDRRVARERAGPEVGRAELWPTQVRPAGTQPTQVRAGRTQPARTRARPARPQAGRPSRRRINICRLERLRPATGSAAPFGGHLVGAPEEVDRRPGRADWSGPVRRPPPWPSGVLVARGVAVRAAARSATRRPGRRAQGGHPAAGQQVVERRAKLAADDRQRRAAQAATLGLIPAVRAGVLAAGHAELERLVERVELAAAELALFVGAGLGQRLVERRIVAQDVVLEALREDLELADPALLRNGRLERVARATPFAERLGQDLGHATSTRGTLPGVSRSPSGARV